MLEAHLGDMGQALASQNTSRQDAGGPYDWAQVSTADLKAKYLAAQDELRAAQQRVQIALERESGARAHFTTISMVYTRRVMEVAGLVETGKLIGGGGGGGRAG